MGGLGNYLPAVALLAQLIAILWKNSGAKGPVFTGHGVVVPSDSFGTGPAGAAGSFGTVMVFPAVGP